MSGVPAVTMPLLAAFRKDCIIFRFSLRILVSFLVNMVISNLQYYSKSEESQQKKKKAYWFSMTFENNHK